MLVSALARRTPARYFILGGTLIFGLAILVFSFTSTLVAGMSILLFAGLGLLLAFSMMNTTIQMRANDEIRGRVMSIYSLMFLGMAPFGSLEIGYLSERFGVMNALRVNASIMLITLAIFYGTQKQIRKI
ncbi:MFS transporter [Candidatus Microgenomates bacterium]|nr:MFS transporter [Candidatus Microgenomates bacterium]